MSILDNIKQNLVYRLFALAVIAGVFYLLTGSGILNQYTVIGTKCTPDDVAPLSPGSCVRWNIELKEKKKGRFLVVETLTLPSPPSTWDVPEGAIISADRLSCTTKKQQRLIYTSTFNGNWRIPSGYPEGLYKLDVTINDKVSKSFYYQLKRYDNFEFSKEVDVFKGTPTIRYGIEQDDVKKAKLTGNTSFENVCHIVRKGNDFYWKSRNYERLLLLDHGAGSSAYYFVSIKGAGLIKIIDLSTTGLKEVEYMEQVSTLLTSITYCGDADYFFKSTTRN
jgi:hypothetical protein